MSWAQQILYRRWKTAIKYCLASFDSIHGMSWATIVRKFYGKNVTPQITDDFANEGISVEILKSINENVADRQYYHQAYARAAFAAQREYDLGS